MNGSLPPISRFTRATRSAQATATRLPVSTEPVKAMQSTRSSRTIASPTSPAPATRFTTPAGRCSKHGASMSVESGVSSEGLQTVVLPAASAGRELPREQQQRVVPGHDAADDAHRLLDDQRQLGGLDRRDHAAGVVAADLGVVVEHGGGPADLVGVLDAAACRPRASSSRRARPCGRACGWRPRAASRRARARASPPSRARPRGPPRSRRRPGPAEAAPTVAIVSSV